MLATNAQLQRLVRRQPSLHRQGHQRSDARAIQSRERIMRHKTQPLVLLQKTARIVTTDPPHRLRQVVRAKTEKLRTPRNLVRQQRRARQLDHRADTPIQRRQRLAVRQQRILFLPHLLRRAPHDRTQAVELRLRCNQRQHNLTHGLDAALAREQRRLENRARLHLANLGVSRQKTRSPMSQHRIALLQPSRAQTRILQR